MLSAPKNRRHHDDAIDQARLLPRYRQPGVNTPASSQHNSTTPTTHRNTRSLSRDVGAGIAGGDHIRLRGIPAIGRGVSGATPGSQPEQTTVHRHGDWTPRREEAA